MFMVRNPLPRPPSPSPADAVAVPVMAVIYADTLNAGPIHDIDIGAIGVPPPETLNSPRYPLGRGGRVARCGGRGLAGARLSMHIACCVQCIS